MIKCKTEISREFRFEAAHRLPFVPEGHKCGRLHGHSFSAIVCVTGPIDEKMGWFMDYADLKLLVQPLIQKLDHYYLNEIEGLDNPTSENIARWLVDHISPLLLGVRLVSVTVKETCNSSCTVYVDG